MQAARLSNRPAKLVTAKLKTTELENLRLELQNRFKDLALNQNAFPQDEFRELKNDVTDAPGAVLR